MGDELLDTNDIKTLIREQGREQKEAIKDLCVEIRGMATAITKYIGVRQTNGNGQNNWQLLMAVAAIMFGLMTPLYMSMSTVSEAVKAVDARTKENRIYFDSYIKDREDAINIKLLREMTLANDVQNTAMENIRRDLDRLARWQETRDETYPPKWLTDRVDKLEIANINSKEREITK